MAGKRSEIVGGIGSMIHASKRSVRERGGGGREHESAQKENRKSQ